MKLEFYRHIFEQSSNTKFHENTSSVGGVFYADENTERQTERHDKSNSRLLQFWELF
jgi:hypothetical protein